MAWFLNFYKCDRCRRRWTDEWSCMCDHTCPGCGARDMTPYESEELTTMIEAEGNQFIVLWSPETAEHDPDYRELGRFPSREQALEFLSAGQGPDRPIAVIPEWSKGPYPESRDSGFALRAPRNDAIALHAGRGDCAQVPSNLNDTLSLAR